jgi:hypothetical protein
MFKKVLRFAAIFAMIMAVLFTGIGGVSNMIGGALVITEKHAWNDGIFMAIVAIFLLILSFV